VYEHKRSTVDVSLWWASFKIHAALIMGGASTVTGTGSTMVRFVVHSTPV
jgi:hypothetical protein